MAPQYELMSALWSFGQDARWRRFLVSRVRPGSRVLDVATGTGLVARALRKRGSTVVGLDQSERMSRQAFERGLPVVLGQAERLPFADGSFDALTFTYLMRYVDDPAATLAELARVIRPGGTLACLEFFVPPNPLWRAAWWAYTRLIMPPVGRVTSPEWHGAGKFLGPSISRLYREHPLAVQGEWWAKAEMRDVRYRTMSLGGGIVFWGTKRE